MKLHKTKNGRNMQICEMDDNHLKNTINLFLSGLNTSRNILEEKEIQTRFAKKWNKRSMNFDDAEDFIERFQERFPHYLEEALIRNLDISREIESYRKIIERKPESQLLPPPLDDFESFENDYNESME